MKEYTTDGHVVTNGDGYMGIFSAVSLLNDVVKVNENLKQQLKEAEKVIEFYAEMNREVLMSGEFARKYKEKYKLL